MQLNHGCISPRLHRVRRPRSKGSILIERIFASYGFRNSSGSLAMFKQSAAPHGVPSVTALRIEYDLFVWA
jgi:hypothetical protein